MRTLLAPIALAVALCSAPALADAACVVAYKAKRDNPLTLFYDTVRISGPCTKANAQARLNRLLTRRGLTLLKIVSVRRI